MSEYATNMLLKKDVCIKGIFDPMDDDEMFHDDIFFQIPGLDEELDSGDMPKRISMAAVCVWVSCRHPFSKASLQHTRTVIQPYMWFLHDGTG